MSKQTQTQPPKPQSPAVTTPDQPRTVLEAKVVEIALVTYLDESNQRVTGLAVVGDHKVHMLESRNLGFSRATTPQGPASEWLRSGIFEKLNKKTEGQ